MKSVTGHQLRKDPVTGRWVIIDQASPETHFSVLPDIKSSKTCPFCPGQNGQVLLDLMSGKTEKWVSGEAWSMMTQRPVTGCFRSWCPATLFTRSAEFPVRGTRPLQAAWD